MHSRLMVPLLFLIGGFTLATVAIWYPNASQQSHAAQPPVGPWAAVAPSEVEPINGFLRLSAGVSGRVAHVAIKIGQRVGRGALLIELENADLAAKVRAAEAEVVFRTTERDNALAKSAAPERQRIEDALEKAEVALAAAQAQLDTVTANTANNPTDNSLTNARGAHLKAKADRDAAQDAQTMLAAQERTVPPTRQESALSIARAELQAAVGALERTRIRAPTSGTILDLKRAVGEAVDGTNSDPIIVLGDVSRLQVRAELPARDITNVSAGQLVEIKGVALHGTSVRGRVGAIAPMLRPNRLLARTLGAPTSDTILEVVIQLDQSASLTPGMRVDTFFHPLPR